MIGQEVIDATRISVAHRDLDKLEDTYPEVLHAFQRIRALLPPRPDDLPRRIRLSHPSTIAEAFFFDPQRAAICAGAVRNRDTEIRGLIASEIEQNSAAPFQTLEVLKRLMEAVCAADKP